MPPRKPIIPVKPVTIERSHEENQERAYIAASRRNDRSIEARVESAKRASEIHKQRTGRALRITEEDVVNGEVYEEEADDPDRIRAQYRNLTAYLQSAAHGADMASAYSQGLNPLTGGGGPGAAAPYPQLSAHLTTDSPDFNKRLTAYLTNTVAVRSALEQAINEQYAQHFPNAPRFNHYIPPPVPAKYASPPEDDETASPEEPVSPRSPHQHRHTPYPMPGSSSYRPSAHGRVASTSVVHGLQSAYTANAKSRGDRSLASRRGSAAGPTLSLADLSARSASASSPEELSMQYPDDRAISPLNSFTNSPFTPTLPLNAQQMVGSALDPSDPLTATLMSGSERFPMPARNAMFYNYGASDIAKGSKKTISATATPAASSMRESTAVKSTAEDSKDQPSDTAGLDFDFSSLDADGTFDFTFGGSDGLDFGNGDAAWDAFIDEGALGKDAT